MRSLLCHALVLLLVLPAFPQSPQGATAKLLLGYSSAASSTEREWEAKFQQLPAPENIRANMQRLSARPHNVGSPYDKENAEWMRQQFESWGWQATIESFDVLFPTPKERSLELISPTHFIARLQEPPVSVDSTSNQTAEQLPTYNAYSADGDVTGPLVYVNYGMRDDYDELEKRGISVKGAIVIARYGAGWRGIKPKVAAEHGALGCLIYSDPRDDGYAEGSVFPEGAYRPKDGVQRGSVQDTYYPGDPLTPGVGATKDAKRLPLAEAQTITKIPVMPISYADAEPLLRAIEGPVAPESWRGGLPITYRIGPGPGRVHFVMKSNWDLKPLYDVVARIPGSQYPDQWVIRGNHHDAWVNGADDPVSGMSAELEEARALGTLLKQGWRPKRTIIYAAWDGEEPGLLGSTEWVETHQDELRQHVVMYINSDNTGRGFLRASGSHTLERFVNDVARDIRDPETNLSIWQRARALRIQRANGTDERKDIRERADWRITALGDGSDYAPFLDHAGIAALDLRFGGEDGGGVYHSIYDDFYWYTHFSDTKFVYGRALSQLVGTAMMRMADAELIPLSFGDSAETIGRYVTEIKKLLKTEQDKATEVNLELQEGIFAATNDPQKPMQPPAKEDVPPAINFKALEEASAAYTKAAADYEKAFQAANSANLSSANKQLLERINVAMQKSEQSFLSDQGLPGRPWFKHMVYAPGAYTGYAVKTLPFVREAVEQKKWSEAEQGVTIVSQALQRQAEQVTALTQELNQLSGGK